jgi:MFS family permease
MAARTTERWILGAAGVTEGAILATFCSAISALLGRHYYELSSAQYAALFAPQIVTGVGAALIAARSARRRPRGQMLRSGLGLNLAALALLIGALAVNLHFTEEFPLLLIASALAGAGLGLVYEALTAFAWDANPTRPERPIIVLNLTLFAGLIVSPALEIPAATAGVWWAVPALLCGLSLLLMAVATRSRLGPDAARASALLYPGRAAPARHLVYVLLALVTAAGVIMPAAWSQIYMPGQAVPHPALRPLLLAAFWAAMVMLARIAFAAIERRRTWQRTTSLVPFLLATAVVAIGLAIGQPETAVIGVVLLAAVVCGAFLPLTAGPRDGDLAVLSLAFTAAFIGLYPVGLGLAGPSIRAFEGAGASLLAIIVVAGALAVAASLAAAGLLAWPQQRRTESPGRDLATVAV